MKRSEKSVMPAETGSQDGGLQPKASSGGAVYCRMLDERDCSMTSWKASWSLTALEGAPGKYRAVLDMEARGGVLHAEVEVSADGAGISFPERGRSCRLGTLRDIPANKGCLAPLLGMADAATASHCLCGFDMAEVWSRQERPADKGVNGDEAPN